MRDLIDRQEAIDALCYVCGNDCDKTEFVYNSPQWEQVIICPEHYALSTLPSEQPELRWNPCSERLPEKGLRVLMQLNNAWQIVGWYDKEDKQWYALPFSQEVVNDCVLAWMPLPDAYEE